MSFTEKIDVLELLIKIIQEHEEKLDKITNKLETIANSIESFRGELESDNPAPIDCIPVLANIQNMEGI